ncbi:hypothetical protein GCM10027034_12960 [Ramlibacter solisilvae]
MDDFALIMPMAGRGSRFATMGMPKPLIEIAGKPFFWWAVESVRRCVPLRKSVFVVLDEHCTKFDMDARVLSFYPDATIVRVPDVTAGAAETAMLGLRQLAGAGPVAINDCDHAFDGSALPDLARRLGCGDISAALLCFRSNDPSYSYAALDDAGFVIGTVEKRVVSPHAIAGCYLFADAALFLDEFETYRAQCPYHELFMSGICNGLAQRGQRMVKADLGRHWTFGTPDEYSRVPADDLARAFT